MKKTSEYRIILILLMNLSVLFQSCVVYHKTPVTMAQAAKDNIKTRILLKDGRVEKFKFVRYQGQQYYGTRMTGNGPVIVPIDINSVSRVHVKNRTASFIATASPITVLSAMVIAAIVGWQ